MSTRWILSLMLAATSTIAMAQGVPAQERLTARELFFVPAAKTVAASRANTGRSGGASTGSGATRDQAPVEVARKMEKLKPAPADMQRNRSEAQIIQAGFVPENLKPLGLRYTIIKRVGNNAEEVPASTVFRSGDRIQVAVESNEDGYLYIIARGSSGAWKPLFPSPETEGGNNLIRAGKATTVPSGFVFTFDEQAGEEKLFVVFSRKPEPSLESLIYDLGTGGAKKPAAKPSQIAGSDAGDGSKTLLASNRIDIRDDVVGNLRRVYARDLIVEKVEGPAQPSSYSGVRPLDANYQPTMRNADYIVNPSSSSDARVVADVTLVHK